MNQQHDDAIEALLKKQFDGPLPNEGFAERVMQRLPQRRRRLAWPLWIGITTGACACWLSLADVPLLHIGLLDLIRGQLSMAAITLLSAVAGMSLLACWWTLSEADDR